LAQPARWGRSSHLQRTLYYSREALRIVRLTLRRTARLTLRAVRFTARFAFRFFRASATRHHPHSIEILNRHQHRVKEPQASARLVRVVTAEPSERLVCLSAAARRHATFSLSPTYQPDFERTTFPEEYLEDGPLARCMCRSRRIYPGRTPMLCWHPAGILISLARPVSGLCPNVEPATNVPCSRR